MFEVENTYFNSKKITFKKEGVSIEVGSIDKDDSASQANFVISILESLYQLTNSQADGILIDKLCDKYDLVKK